MIESEWLTCAHPDPMLNFLTRDPHSWGQRLGHWLGFKAEEGLSLRKQRLFDAACCRRIWHLLEDKRSRHAVHVAEEFADNLSSEEELVAAFEAASQVASLPATPAKADKPEQFAALAALFTVKQDPWSNHELVHSAAMQAVAWAAGDDFESVLQTEAKAQAHLLRELFGNPFRPVPFDPAWLERSRENLTRIAQTIYDTRRFEEMALLGYALMEAGCFEEAVLSHCRSTHEHARGCWVLDAILQKA